MRRRPSHLRDVAHADARFSFLTTPGKLPKDVVPSHYVLRIAPASTHDRFEGQAAIDITVTAPVAAITLNAADLRFDSAQLRASSGEETELAPSFDRERETVTLSPGAGLIAAGSYVLRIDYSGRIGKFSQGLYQIPYKLNEQGRIVDKMMLATHMEPVHARKLFPGWDEPAFRASFEITAVVEQPLTVVSNMPVSAIKPEPGDRKEVSFARSAWRGSKRLTACGCYRTRLRWRKPGGSTSRNTYPWWTAWSMKPKSRSGIRSLSRSASCAD